MTFHCFILQVDKLRMRGDQLNAEIALSNFRDWELSRFQPLVPGMDVLAKNFKVKELPLICFEGMYEGGKLEAMKKRRQLRDADPVRQEKRRVARLEALKAKMAEIQKKKDEQQDRKRKREEVEEEEKLAEVVKEEVETSEKAEPTGDAVEATTDEPANEEEANLLESAFDTVNDGKSREEAAADRQKLLAGELIAADEQGGDDSDDEAAMYDTEMRQDFQNMVKKRADAAPSAGAATGESRDIRSLPVSEKQKELLRLMGCNLVSDDEAVQLGADLLPPWRGPNAESNPKPVPKRGKIKFREKFDIVELDALGHVIDKGDEDFQPSKNWIGRKAGFEFKLGGFSTTFHDIAAIDDDCTKYSHTLTFSFL